MIRFPLSLLFSPRWKDLAPSVLPHRATSPVVRSSLWPSFVPTLCSHTRQSPVIYQTPDDAQTHSFPSCLWDPCHLTWENNRKPVYAKPVRYRKQIQPEGHVKGVRNWVKVQFTESKPVQQVLTGVQYTMGTACKFYAVKRWKGRRYQLRTHTSHRWHRIHVRRVPNKI